VSKCPLCLSSVKKNIYQINNIPLFQNKVYKTRLEAENAKTGEVEIVHCESCDYVYNQKFDYNIMAYDDDYQNEQANSIFFQNYLCQVIDFIESKGFSDKKIIEIGCGKGYFINELWKRGIDAIGFDPAYEGDNDKIVKDYFSDKYDNTEADLIIMRHTLEHIQDPLKFLQTIRKAVNSKCHVFIEVPSFEWIVEHRAFWDIFYEHCNYFTQNCLENMFLKSEHGLLFNNQYQYILASMGDFLTQISNKTIKQNIYLDLSAEVKRYKKFILENKNTIVWGAGAKGAQFLNILDPNADIIECVVDINPMKQGCFIGGSAHQIISPEDLINQFDSAVILLMNENYESEIRGMLDNKNFKVYSLGA